MGMFIILKAAKAMHEINLRIDLIANVEFGGFYDGRIWSRINFIKNGGHIVCDPVEVYGSVDEILTAIEDAK